jgi:hypothetical protein
MIVATADFSPLLTSQALVMVSLLVVCGSVKFLNKVLDEVTVEPVSEAGLAINQSFDVLVRKYNHFCDESAEGSALRGEFIDLFDGRGARKGELLVEEADDLVDGDILNARDVVLVAEDVEFH